MPHAAALACAVYSKTKTSPLAFLCCAQVCVQWRHALWEQAYPEHATNGPERACDGADVLHGFFRRAEDVWPAAHGHWPAAGDTTELAASAQFPMRHAAGGDDAICDGDPRPRIAQIRGRLLHGDRQVVGPLLHRHLRASHPRRANVMDGDALAGACGGRAGAVLCDGTVIQLHWLLRRCAQQLHRLRTERLLEEAPLYALQLRQPAVLHVRSSPRHTAARHALQPRSECVATPPPLLRRDALPARSHSIPKRAHAATRFLSSRRP